jgi:hypothetical protein
MITWGAALVLAAYILVSGGSLPGALAAAGFLLMIVGAITAIIEGYVGVVREGDDTANGEAAAQPANPSAFDQGKSDVF